jgi:hypothetical protein
MTAFPDLARRASLILTLVTLMAIGCSPLTDNGPPHNSYRVHLDESHPDLQVIGGLIFRGGLVIRDRDSQFGGLSGIEVDHDGSRFIAVSDKGRVVTAALDYDPAGNLTAARDIAVAPLLDGNGKKVRGSRHDSEGLARLPDGRWAVSFEYDHRVELYPANAAGPVTPPLAPLPELPVNPGDRWIGGNSGPEAVAALPDGRLLVIEEGIEKNAGQSRAWLGGQGGWEKLSYRGKAPYRPTDAAVLPGGDVLVLERRASLLGGFGARIVRLSSDSLRAGSALSGTELAVLEPPLTTDNFEGLSVVERPDGSLMLYVVTDNNLWKVQRTLLLMFEIPPK